ncbi:MAG: hypothetical protein IIV53_11810, partial [Bacteroidaceae bacterium]|nr:hypothetical protein [Bacteroidaceae bacterium]
MRKLLRGAHSLDDILAQLHAPQPEPLQLVRLGSGKVAPHSIQQLLQAAGKMLHRLKLNPQRLGTLFNGE